MTYILGISLAACIPALLTLSVLYVRAGHESASERLLRGEAELRLAQAGASLQASEGQRARLALAVARYSREIRELEEFCVTVGDAPAVARRLNNLLSAPAEDSDSPGPGAPSGPVPAWVSPDASSPD